LDYVKEIIESLELLKEKEEGDEISIRDIRENIEKLEEVKDLLVAFEKNQSKQLQTHTKEHKNFLQDVGDDEAREIISGITAVRSINSNLVAHNEITEKLELLAYNLGLLKSTILTKDFKTTKRMMKKLLSKDDFGIKGVISHTTVFKENVEMLKQEYDQLVSKAAGASKGVDSVAELVGKNAAIDRLQGLHEKQKAILVMISSEFAKVSKQLLRDKEYKKFLRKK
jgi:hypothetical protein